MFKELFLFLNQVAGPTGPNNKTKRARRDSNPRPNAPQAFALSMLCNEPKNCGRFTINLDCDSVFEFTKQIWCIVQLFESPYCRQGNGFDYL